MKVLLEVARPAQWRVSSLLLDPVPKQSLGGAADKPAVESKVAFFTFHFELVVW